MDNACDISKSILYIHAYAFIHTFKVNGVGFASDGWRQGREVRESFARSNLFFWLIKSLSLSECRGVWPIMSRHRLLQQAAARRFYQGTRLVFVIGSAGNGMQISPHSSSAIIYRFAVNERKWWKKVPKSVKADSGRIRGQVCSA